MKKIMVLCQWGRESMSGAGSVLSDFLSEIPKEQYFFVSHKVKNNSENQKNSTQDNFFFYPRQLGKKIGLDNLIFIFCVLLMILRLPLYFRTIRKNNAEAILIPSSDFRDLFVGYMSNKILKTPYILLVMDDIEDAAKGRSFIEQILMRLFVKTIIRSADSVVVLTDFLRMDYLKRYDVNARCIYPGLDIENYEKSETLSENLSGAFHIVLTGHIYEAQFDAAVAFLKALNEIKNRKIVVSIYGDNEIFEKTAARFVLGYKIRFLKANRGQIYGIQKGADLLFLPLAFHSKVQNCVRTAFPAKLAEYLCSGRPILLCVPADSFVSAYAKKHRFAFVLNQLDPQAVKQAIETIAEQKEETEALVNNARTIVRQQHSSKKQSAEFARVLCAA